MTSSSHHYGASHSRFAFARAFFRNLRLLVCGLALASCSKPQEPSAAAPPADEGEQLRIGSIVIYRSDLDYYLKEKHDSRSDEATRELALTELAERARIVQAALDAKLDRDPIVRAEVARLLATRLKETALFPKLKASAATPIAEDRLREIYDTQAERFASKEKRQIAVLWLNPGPDPARAKSYTGKLTKARDWFFNESDLAKHPDKGFSVLSVDHSEHAATRFKGGVLGWLEAGKGSTDWLRAVTEIGFSISETGGVSPVTSHSEGIFLVRLMGVKPAVQRPFESVRAELERAEHSRLRAELEDQFYKAIESTYR